MSISSRIESGISTCLPASLAIAAGCICVQSLAQNKNSDTNLGKRQNVLFIIVDDMRPEVNCYGATSVVSPNIDALAADGVKFSNAYCNIAVSGASRSSLLTGTRPTRNTFIYSYTNASIEKPDIESINETFKKAGYTTLSLGKVFHNESDHVGTWDKINRNEPRMRYLSPENLAIRKGPTGKRGYAYECLDVADNAYPDGETTEEAMADLERLSREDKPIFMCLGLSKPHAPFIAPKKYWDMYDYDKITLPDNYVMPDGHGIPREAFPGWGEMRNYTGIPQTGPIPVDTARKLIHGYWACVSYVDAQIGKVRSKLAELGLDKNTVIVLVGDHGWSLGEHGLWAKHSVFNTSLHAMMIVSDPQAKIKGYDCREFVEFVDIFPTICDAAGIAKPTHLEGESMLPLLNSKKARSKGYAMCRWGDGYTILTPEKFSYTEWWDANDNVKNRLLFDHNVDAAENRNLVDLPQYRAKIEELSKILKSNRGANFDKYAKAKYKEGNAD